MSEPRSQQLGDLYGALYFDTETPQKVEALSTDLYFYEVYTGAQSVGVERGDCVFYLSDDRGTAHVRRGPLTFASQHVATVVRGYMPEDQSSTITSGTNLPYVNGCSTKQVFAPQRPGDPTLQILSIPPFSAEQAHHVHATVRVAYILEGRGRSLVGMGEHVHVEELYPGKVVVLQKFCPHHFETDGAFLKVLPLHVFSSIPQERSHPMFLGTHLTDAER